MTKLSVSLEHILSKLYYRSICKGARGELSSIVIWLAQKAEGKPVARPPGNVQDIRKSGACEARGLFMMFSHRPGGLAAGFLHFGPPFLRPDLRFALPDLLLVDLAAFGSLLGKQHGY